MGGELSPMGTWEQKMLFLLPIQPPADFGWLCLGSHGVCARNTAGKETTGGGEQGGSQILVQ